MPVGETGEITHAGRLSSKLEGLPVRSVRRCNWWNCPFGPSVDGPGELARALSSQQELLNDIPFSDRRPSVKLVTLPVWAVRRWNW